jgi:hypothetical protein
MHTRQIVAISIAIAIALPAMVRAAESKLNQAAIERITGLKGTYSEREKVFKLSLPRNDIAVRVDGWRIAPFMGLTSWAAFTPSSSSRTMVMGDIVLMQDELNPAMSAALDAGLSVTALHNHFFFDEPKVYFMHIGGEGDAEKLASGVKKVFQRVEEIRARDQQPASRFGGPAIPEQSSISADRLEAILGVKGQTSNGMFKAVWGRNAQMHSTRIGNEMGINTWAAFAGSDDNAVVDGDFAVHENELQLVLRSLRSEGINIVAIHSHMTHEMPRTLFLHYWGRGKAEDLAGALRKTLEAQRAAPADSHGKPRKSVH